jgi:chromosome segregation and condensation protein ScpB
MNIKLSQKSNIQKIEQMQNLLSETEEESTKAKAQEEIILKQLNEIFECESLEEGKELLSQLITEKKETDSDLEIQTDDLWLKMKADGLIK